MAVDSMVLRYTLQPAIGYLGKKEGERLHLSDGPRNYFQCYRNGGLLMKKVVLFLSAFVFIISCAASNIHLAAKQNNLDRVKYFVSKGEVNQYDGVANFQPGSFLYLDNKDRHLGYTPLMVACYYGYAEITDFLCRNGADVNAQNEDGEFPLLFAAQYNYPQITTILIQHGASVNMKDRDGHTALYYAERSKHPQIIEQLKAAAALAE